jgi:MFS family permease/HAMP domain-containing protein
MTLDHSRPLLIRLLILAVLVLVTPLAFISVRALGEFEQGMIPEMDKKAAAIGRDVAAQVSRAVGYGIPVDRLVGVSEFFAPVLSANPEIRYLAITDPQGRVLFIEGAGRDELEPHYRSADPEGAKPEGTKASIGPFLDLALPLLARDQIAGHVHVGFDQNYIGSLLSDILADVLVVSAASLVVAFEILLFVVFVNVSGPLKLVRDVIDKAAHGDFAHLPGGQSDDEVGHFVRAVQKALRQVDGQYRRLAAYMDEVRQAHFDKSVVERVGDIASRINFQYRFSPAGRPEPMFERRATDIRLALFLFVFAEELSRSFMPLFAGKLAPSLPGLSPEMVMALPIAAFMAAIAIASPWAGQLAERVGPRRLFLIGVVPTALGSLLTGFAVGAFDLALWRALTGFGYALTTMACQSYISSSLKTDQRAQGLGVYVAAVLTAGICGNALGGVLAERVGFRASFFVSAVLVVLAAMLVSRLLAPTETAAQDGQPHRNRHLMRLFRNWRFTVLMLFSAVPSKMALTGFLFFLVPVTMAHGQWQVAEIARVMVLYPLVMVLVSPLSARLADRLGWRAGQVALGGLVGGIGLMAPLVLGSGPLPVALAIVALGISHGMSASPTLAMLPDLCWTECRSVGYTNVLAFVRLVERIGSVAGPLLAAALIPLWGLWGATVALGTVVLALSAVFAIASGAYGSGPHIETEEDGE